MAGRKGQSKEEMMTVQKRKWMLDCRVFLPTEHTQNQVEHEEGANQDECGEVDPWPFHSYSIIHLSDQAHFFVFITYYIIV